MCLSWGETHVVAGAEGEHGLGVDVGRLEPPVEEHGERLVGGGEDVQPGDDGGRVDKGVLEVRVAGEQLRLQVPRVGDALEEGDVDAVRGRHVLEGDGLEERHRRGVLAGRRAPVVFWVHRSLREGAGVEVCRELVELPPSWNEVTASWGGAAPTWCQLGPPCCSEYLGT